MLRTAILDDDDEDGAENEEALPKRCRAEERADVSMVPSERTERIQYGTTQVVGAGQRAGFETFRGRGDTFLGGVAFYSVGATSMFRLFPSST